jgi:hypothetical protein
LVVVSCGDITLNGNSTCSSTEPFGTLEGAIIPRVCQSGTVPLIVQCSTTTLSGSRNCNAVCCKHIDISTYTCTSVGTHSVQWLSFTLLVSVCQAAGDTHLLPRSRRGTAGLNRPPSRSPALLHTGQKMSTGATFGLGRAKSPGQGSLCWEGRAAQQGKATHSIPC